MQMKRISRYIAGLVLAIAFGYGLYRSGVGQWARQQYSRGFGTEVKENDGQQDEQEESAPVAPDDDVKLKVKDFSREVRSEKSGEVEARIAGEEAVLEKNNLYRIFSPVVTSLVSEVADDQGVDVQMNQVRLTAERAIFHESKSRVELNDSVQAAGEDFQVTTESVSYYAAEHKIEGSQPVRMQRYRVGPDGKKVRRMLVTGTGLRGDLVVRTVSVLSDVEARLLNVSEDFMASGVPEGEKPDDATRDIVIRSDGPMTYEDGARKVTFTENVRVTTGTKKLTADQLEIRLGKTEAKDKLQVTGITASKKVSLHFKDQTAKGEKLVWQNVTQAGVLTGTPATLTTRRFSVEGERLTFVRLDSRFQVKGEGKLVRKTEGETGETKTEKESGRRFMSSGDPIEVTWAEGMTYEAASRRASFEKDVHAVQGGTSLRCDDLDMDFEQEDNAVRQVLARGDVMLREQLEWGSRWVKCGRASWSRTDNVIEMQAGEKKSVVVKAGSELLESGTVIYDLGENRFECPAPGELLVSASEGKGATAEPMRVRWEESMRYDRGSEPRATFSGKVRVRQPGRTLKAGTLRVTFTGERRPVHILARNEAVLEVLASESEATEKPEEAPKATNGEGEDTENAGPRFDAGSTDWRLESEQVEGFIPENRMEARGDGKLEVLRENKDNDWIRWSDRMEADFDETFARFEGNVRANFGGSELQSGKLSLDFNEERELRHMNCTGEVQFQSGGQRKWKMESASAEAIFAPGSILSQIIARDDVEVRDAERRLRSEFLTLFFRGGEDAEEQSLDRAVARKNVVVRYTGEASLTAWCERLDWDADTERYKLTGTPARLSRDDIEIDGETIIVDRMSGRVSLPGGESPARTSIEEDAD